MLEMAAVSALAGLCWCGLPWWALAVLLYLGYWLPKWFWVPLVDRIAPKEVVFRAGAEGSAESAGFALTFDDSPAEATRAIAAVLEEHKMRGTFFVIGCQVTCETRPILVELLRNGHQLANHGMTNSLHALKSERGLEQEILGCDAILEELHAAAKRKYRKIYRPGCGFTTPMMVRKCRELGHLIALGSVYPNDPLLSCAALNDWYLWLHVQDRDIVILHDRPATVTLLRKCLPWLSENSLRSAPLSSLLQ